MRKVKEKLAQNNKSVILFLNVTEITSLVCAFVAKEKNITI